MSLKVTRIIYEQNISKQNGQSNLIDCSFCFSGGKLLLEKNIERIKLDGAKLDVDFIVVSKLAYKYDDDPIFEGYPVPGDCFAYEEEMDDSTYDGIADTFFQEELIDYVYDVGPNVDIKLAVTLGLGVIQSLHDGSLSLYNADTADYELRLVDEMLRLGIYYQITNPEYDDRQLDRILHGKDGGVHYLARSIHKSS